MAPFLRGTRYPLLSPEEAIKYLLRDEFSADRAAGSVNGTAAEPGPGTRTVRDVESKIALSSGYAEFTAQATPDYAEQDIVYSTPAITRAAGQVVLCKWRCATDEAHYPLALVDSATPVWTAYANVIHGFYRSGALTLSSVDNAAIGVPLMPFVADGTIYWLAIVLQATGAYYFCKGGVFTDWTFLKLSGVGNATPLYVASSGLTAVFSTTNYRVPMLLYSGELVAGE